MRNPSVKKLHLPLIFAIVFMVLNFTKPDGALAQSICVVSYNIRYDTPKDGENSWDNRKGELLPHLLSFKPDIVGFQEAEISQVNYLSAHLAGFDFIGVGRKDGKEGGEFSPIYYKKDRFKLIDFGTFWLSENWESPSVGWDAAMERICTFGKFRVKESGDTILVFNTHFDHVGKEARTQSASLIVEKIIGMNVKNYAIILTGDFNALPTEDPIQILSHYFSKSFKQTTEMRKGPFGTFVGFEDPPEEGRCIDYIFTKGFTIDSYLHDARRRTNGLQYSDHLPIVTHLNLN